MNKEIKLYLIFGVLTTIVNYSVFAAGIYFLGEKKALQVNIVAFICATVFAFVTNKIYVFEKKTIRYIQIIEEFGKFVLSRLFSMGFEQLGLYICIECFFVSKYKLFGISGLMIAKIVFSFVAVMLNYIASKWIVFVSKEDGK